MLGISRADSAYHLRCASLRQSFWPWPCAADGRRLNEACGIIYGASFTGWFGGWLQVLRDSPWICLKTWLTDSSTICDWGFSDCSSCFSNELFFSHWLSFLLAVAVLPQTPGLIRAQNEHLEAFLGFCTGSTKQMAQSSLHGSLMCSFSVMW